VFSKRSDATRPFILSWKRSSLSEKKQKQNRREPVQLTILTLNFVVKTKQFWITMAICQRSHYWQCVCSV